MNLGASTSRATPEEPANRVPPAEPEHHAPPAEPAQRAVSFAVVLAIDVDDRG